MNGNGYTYSNSFDAMAGQQPQHNNANNIMMMGQNGMGGMSGSMGGQSLDDIVNQNAKVMRRQSIPQQGYNSGHDNMDDDMRRTSSMMGYDGGGSANTMNNYSYTSNANLNQNGMMSGGATPAQSQHQRSQSRRLSQDLSLNTSFANNTQGYSAMMPPNSAYTQSPAHVQSGIDMSMNSPYVDPNIGMNMDFNVDQNLDTGMGSESMQLNMYNQQQFNQSMMNSPIHSQLQQSNTNARRSSGQDPGGGSGMSTQYGGHGSNSSSNTVRQPSRSHSLNVNDNASPMRSGTPQGSFSQPNSATQNHQQANSSFRGHPQYPRSGSQQDRPIPATQSTEGYNGLNGPLPVNPGNYNPNNQNFAWDTPEGGWPSTMSGRPHMHSVYKNAYSSTGFDMLGVLVRISKVS